MRKSVLAMMKLGLESMNTYGAGGHTGEVLGNGYAGSSNDDSSLHVERLGGRVGIQKLV